MNSYRKVKTVAKDVLVHGPELTQKILKTMKTISDLVGSTLGPGGRPVLLERQEYGLPNILTKDGVTAFRYLGFRDPTEHVILEAARDAATRTANEAGDGPQPLWSNILTPNGFVSMKNIKVGMDICGTNGTIQKVIGIYPKGEKEIIKVTFEQGQMVECCEDHLWSVTTNYGSEKLLTVKEIEKDYKKLQKDGSFTSYKYFTPTTIVEFDKNNDLPLDPYLLGVLIGDGSLSDSGSIELSLGAKKEHILSKLILPKGFFTVTTFSEKKGFRVKINGKDLSGRYFREVLEEVGLRNTDSYSKFIPKLYLFSSITQRQALLKGLIDTDGHINGRGRFEFSTVSEQLAGDFKFLCNSLGKNIYSTLHKRTEGDGSYSKRPVFRFIELAGCKYGLKISDIKRTGQFTQMQCIKVSNEDHLYITDDFVVTHNTTTATVLSEAIVRNTDKYCKANPKITPQKIVRKLEKIFKETIEPTLKNNSMVADDRMLHSVAKLSANGDADLANAVMKCFELVGDDGNISIVEHSGPSGYEIETLKGFPIGIGYEESCGKFSAIFVNDRPKNRCYIEKPVFILYFGALTDIQTAVGLLRQIGRASSEDYAELGLDKKFTHNVVIVATGFSETVLAVLSNNFSNQETINAVPLLTPKGMIQNSELHFLHDLSAVTGAKVFDPITCPLDNAKLSDLGYGIQSFEMTRYRSTILGLCDEDLVLSRAEELKQAIANPESKLDAQILAERLGKLTGGIAKLKVVGPSSGELREKRDRAEDAICAVRGAMKHGCLPGGGWGLKAVITKLNHSDPVVSEVLVPSLQAPIIKMLNNCGLSEDEIVECYKLITTKIVKVGESKVIETEGTSVETQDYKRVNMVYDAWEGKQVDAIEGGILDSTPAVIEAIRNSISIATLLGTLGGTVVYPRDDELERKEAIDSSSFMKDYNSNFDQGE